MTCSTVLWFFVFVFLHCETMNVQSTLIKVPTKQKHHNKFRSQYISYDDEYCSTLLPAYNWMSTTMEVNFTREDTTAPICKRSYLNCVTNNTKIDDPEELRTCAVVDITLYNSIRNLYVSGFIPSNLLKLIPIRSLDLMGNNTHVVLELGEWISAVTWVTIWQSFGGNLQGNFPDTFLGTYFSNRSPRITAKFFRSYPNIVDFDLMYCQFQNSSLPPFPTVLQDARVEKCSSFNPVDINVLLSEAINLKSLQLREVGNSVNGEWKSFPPSKNLITFVLVQVNLTSLTLPSDLISNVLDHVVFEEMNLNGVIPLSWYSGIFDLQFIRAGNITIQGPFDTICAAETESTLSTFRCVNCIVNDFPPLHCFPNLQVFAITDSVFFPTETKEYPIPTTCAISTLEEIRPCVDFDWHGEQIHGCTKKGNNEEEWCQLDEDDENDYGECVTCHRIVYIRSTPNAYSLTLRNNVGLAEVRINTNQRTPVYLKSLDLSNNSLQRIEFFDYYLGRPYFFAESVKLKDNNFTEDPLQLYLQPGLVKSLRLIDVRNNPLMKSLQGVSSSHGFSGLTAKCSIQCLDYFPPCLPEALRFSEDYTVAVPGDYTKRCRSVEPRDPKLTFSFLRDLNFFNQIECACSEGFTGIGGECFDCPTNWFCPISPIWSPWAGPAEEYFVLTRSNLTGLPNRIARCRVDGDVGKTLCLQGRVRKIDPKVLCTSNRSFEMVENACSFNHDGWMCSSCKQGYGSVGTNCWDCDTFALFAMFVWFFLSTGMTAFWSSKWARKYRRPFRRSLDLCIAAHCQLLLIVGKGDAINDAAVTATLWALSQPVSTCPFVLLNCVMRSFGFDPTPTNKFWFHMFSLVTVLSASKFNALTVCFYSQDFLLLGMQMITCDSSLLSLDADFPLLLWSDCPDSAERFPAQLMWILIIGWLLGAVFIVCITPPFRNRIFGSPGSPFRTDVYSSGYILARNSVATFLQVLIPDPRQKSLWLSSYLMLLFSVERYVPYEKWIGTTGPEAKTVSWFNSASVVSALVTTMIHGLNCETIWTLFSEASVVVFHVFYSLLLMKTYFDNNVWLCASNSKKKVPNGIQSDSSIVEETTCDEKSNDDHADDSHELDGRLDNNATSTARDDDPYELANIDVIFELRNRNVFLPSPNS
eukprot:PhF_6_TR39847/c0_g1_i1/m.59250